MTKLFNPYILVIALLYGLWQTAYFGWNAFPGSEAEIIADGITALIFALSISRGRGKADLGHHKWLRRMEEQE